VEAGGLGQVQGSSAPPWVWLSDDVALNRLALMLYQSGETLDWRAVIEDLNQQALARGLCVESGLPLKFVAASEHSANASQSAVAYETGIHSTGQVPCRTQDDGAWHDAFNAFQWLLFPRSKARLNAMQVAAIRAQSGETVRSRLRDAITLLDEGGAVWAGAATDDDHWKQLEMRQWPELLFDQREVLMAKHEVRLFGHALMQKMRHPYKSITGWVVRLPVARDAQPDEVDQALVEWLEAAGLEQRPWLPLPVMGWPGWDRGSEAREFYEDVGVFRPSQ
jgi:hypothetical protein